MTPPSAVRRVLALAALLLACAGCGEDTDESDPSDRATGVDSPVTIVDGEVQISCGGRPGWLPSQMTDGIPSERSERELHDALAQGVEAFGTETAYPVPDWPDTAWRLLTEEDDLLTFGLGEWDENGPLDNAGYFSVRRDDAGWMFAGSGDCQPTPLLPEGLMWVEVSAEAPPDPTASVLTVELNETACTGARDPSPHLKEAALVETKDSVTVYWTSTPPTGPQDCPGNPTISREITLSEPLGERDLLDGSRWPPSPIGS